ncbi:hypothetical protein NQ315_006736 [Exocentrus adspersus]|uniref:Uncharacterized protein n=1 Tax=Exocentrus adspersus TaxID=1586481 RepID=A0AAV8WD51_9CUCU|nr:hypothetical protein NQ315_006736 [Exocentrus adspersus]
MRIPEYEVVPIQHVRKRSIADIKENVIEDTELRKTKEPYDNRILDSSKNNLRLKAFGTPFNLSLVPTEGLLKKGKLKIWTIEPNATSQHGVDYVELPEKVYIQIRQLFKKSLFIINSGEPKCDFIITV